MQTNGREKIAWLRPAFMLHIGTETFAKLIEHYGSAQNVWHEQAKSVKFYGTRRTNDS